MTCPLCNAPTYRVETLPKRRHLDCPTPKVLARGLTLEEARKIAAQGRGPRAIYREAL